jgi:exodeoxyribonuclease-3
MKLITWNCQGAYRKKADAILKWQPDILVVQECERPDKLVFNSTTIQPNDVYWHGDNVHKGLGIFSYSEYRFELLPVFKPEYRYILPIHVTGHGQKFTLLAIWAMDNKENRQARYIGQIWLAIRHYTKLLSGPVILTGDFNSNKIWDSKDRVGNHSDVVGVLAKKNILSLYHQHFGADQGKEKHPTFYLHRDKKKPYHLDYCFASSDFAGKLENVEIGTYKKWIALSDHTPINITFNI